MNRRVRNAKNHNHWTKHWMNKKNVCINPNIFANWSTRMRWRSQEVRDTDESASISVCEHTRPIKRQKRTVLVWMHVSCTKCTTLYFEEIKNDANWWNHGDDNDDDARPTRKKNESKETKVKYQRSQNLHMASNSVDFFGHWHWPWHFFIWKEWKQIISMFVMSSGWPAPITAKLESNSKSAKTEISRKRMNDKWTKKKKRTR